MKWRGGNWLLVACPWSLVICISYEEFPSNKLADRQEFLNSSILSNNYASFSQVILYLRDFIFFKVEDGGG